MTSDKSYDSSKPQLPGSNGSGHTGPLAVKGFAAKHNFPSVVFGRTEWEDENWKKKDPAFPRRFS